MEEGVGSALLDSALSGEVCTFGSMLSCISGNLWDDLLEADKVVRDDKVLALEGEVHLGVLMKVLGGRFLGLSCASSSL
jgi:hypothetical protein